MIFAKFSNFLKLPKYSKTYSLVPHHEADNKTPDRGVKEISES